MLRRSLSLVLSRALLVLALGTLTTAFSSAREKDAIALFCEEFRPRLASWVGEFGPQRSLATTESESSAVQRLHLDEILPSESWATRRLKETQSWLDEMRGRSGAMRVKAALSRIAMEWVSVHAYAEKRDRAEVRRSLARIETLASEAERSFCGPGVATAP